MTACTSEFAVEFDGIGRSIGSCRAVDRVSAKFAPAKIHAILGENGAGKSTLMKLLFGLNAPTEGRLSVDGVWRDWRSPADAIAAGLGMVQQHFTLVETLSVIDNIMLGHETTSFGGRLDRLAAIAEMESMLPSRALRLDWHRPVSELSVGEKQKLEILKLIARKAKILVLDEPTAVLTPLEIEELFSILKDLKRHGRTVFVITHKLAEVFDHCDTWFVLRAGRATGLGEVQDAKTDDIVRAMVGSVVPPLSTRQPAKVGGPVLTFKNLSIARGSKSVRELNLEVKAGEILGIAGVDGSGQSEVVEALLGLIPFKGELTVMGRRLSNTMGASVAAKCLRELRDDGLALISEDRHSQSLWLDETPVVNAGLGCEKANGFVRNGWISWPNWKAKANKWMKAFDVRFLSAETAVSRLSGGNQQKLIFARELMGRSVKLIVAHQPTRGVDFAAIRLIHERIIAARDAGAAVLVISSELDELTALSDRIDVLCAGKKTGTFERSFSGVPFEREKIGAAMTNAGL